jgi:hypothetical protein
VTAPTFAVVAAVVATWVIFVSGMLGSYSAVWDGCAADRDVCISRNLP